MDPARSHADKLRNDESFVASFQRKMKFVQRDYDTPCLEWQGGTDKAGYRRIHVKRHCERKTGRNFYAHRLNYMIERKALLNQKNTFCINVITGFVAIRTFLVGDHQENMDDLHDSRRVAGEENSNSKLKEDEVWEILCLYHDEGYSMREISEEYGVARGTISDIVYGRTWGDLYDEFVGKKKMSLEELFYFVIGLMVIYMVYWQIFIANDESHKEKKHNGIRYSRGFIPGTTQTTSQLWRSRRNDLWRGRMMKKVVGWNIFLE